MNRWTRFMSIWFARLVILGSITAGLTWLVYSRSGWQGRVGISNAMFVAGALDIIIGLVTIAGWPMDGGAAIVWRTMIGIRLRQNSTDKQSVMEDMIQKGTFATASLLVGLLTIALAVVITL